MATLSKNPTDWELEDFVSAHFAARRTFVETGITERDPTDILELDVVWTDYAQQAVKRVPVEVKSGANWGLGEIFKFFGWTRYLGIDPGLFVCRKMPAHADQATFTRLCQKIGVSLCHMESLDHVSEKLAPLGLGDPTHKALPELWRYSFWARRRLLKALSKAIDLKVCPETAKVAKNYYKLVNDAIFFEPDVRTRVETLIEAHWQHPRLSKAVAAETAGKKVSFDDPPDTHIFNEALYRGAHFPVQAVLYLEHRARIEIVKAAVDYILARNAGVLPQKAVRILDQQVDLGEAQLHARFVEATKVLEQRKSYRSYPVFWQTFLWGMGGFILVDRREEEYLRLSQESGMPVDEIDDALNLWDTLFPMENGWFAQPRNDGRRLMKLMPAALRGLGAFSRLTTRGLEEYEQLKLNTLTVRRLAQDHNTAVRLLESKDDQLVK